MENDKGIKARINPKAKKTKKKGKRRIWQHLIKLLTFFLLYLL
jgi:hypothetical protein